LSIRATEGGGPPWGTTGLPEPEPKRRNVKLIILAALVAVVVVLGVLVATRVVHVPFIGNKTVTEGDPAFGWTITIPTTTLTSAVSSARTVSKLCALARPMITR